MLGVRAMGAGYIALLHKTFRIGGIELAWGADVSFQILAVNFLRAGCVAAALAAACIQPAFSETIDLTYDSGGSGETARFLTHAAQAAHHGRFSEAIDYDTRALAKRPSFGDAYGSRMEMYMQAGRYAEASADLERLALMRPDDMGLALTRAELDLHRADGTAALAAVKVALGMPLISHRHAPVEAGRYEESGGTRYYVNGHAESYADLYSSIAQQLLHHDDAAVMLMQSMLKIEVIHPEHILADYCYTAAIAGLLETAELMCQQAIDDNAHDIGQYDSLGFTHLRMKNWDAAIADYNKALDSVPDLTLSQYGRGIARRAKGDIAGGNADIAAATSNEPDIANIMRRLGAPAI